MRTTLKTRLALRLADWLSQRACELRHDLQDHLRDETRRIALADKRVRGLRLYAAWSAARSARLEVQPRRHLMIKRHPGHLHHAH